MRDRCWVAWGGAGARRPAPRYFRTRPDAEAFIFGLLVGEPGPALVGFDFAFGYPADAGLPAGRALCARLDGLIRDEADGANNRFEVAGILNREIQAALGGGFDGPFWGHPSGRELREDLIAVRGRTDFCRSPRHPPIVGLDRGECQTTPAGWCAPRRPPQVLVDPAHDRHGRCTACGHTWKDCPCAP